MIQHFDEKPQILQLKSCNKQWELYSKNTISLIIPYKKFVEHNDETDEKADYSLDIYDSFV